MRPELPLQEITRASGIRTLRSRSRCSVRLPMMNYLLAHLRAPAWRHVSARCLVKSTAIALISAALCLPLTGITDREGRRIRLSIAVAPDQASLRVQLLALRIAVAVN